MYLRALLKQNSNSKPCFRFFQALDCCQAVPKANWNKSMVRQFPKSNRRLALQPHWSESRLWLVPSQAQTSFQKTRWS